MTFFWSIEKNIFWKSGKKSGHQYRSKISLRIEWEHSQPLKMPLIEKVRQFLKVSANSSQRTAETIRDCEKVHTIVHRLSLPKRVPQMSTLGHKSFQPLSQANGSLAGTLGIRHTNIICNEKLNYLMKNVKSSPISTFDLELSRILSKLNLLSIGKTAISLFLSFYLTPL